MLITYLATVPPVDPPPLEGVEDLVGGAEVIPVPPPPPPDEGVPSETVTTKKYDLVFVQKHDRKC